MRKLVGWLAFEGHASNLRLGKLFPFVVKLFCTDAKAPVPRLIIPSRVRIAIHFMARAYLVQ